MTTYFKPWRDGLLITGALAALAVYGATKVGLESGWILESHDGAPVAANAVDLKFRERSFGTDLAFWAAAGGRPRSRLVLRTPCSAYDGRYARGLNTIHIDRLSPAWTCAGVDGPLLAAFRQANRYTLQDERLTLTTPDGRALVFRRATWPLGASPRRLYQRPSS